MQRPVWPTGGDYRVAIDEPNALGDSRLRIDELERDPGGRPKAYNGAFTTTFHFKTARGIALRCYTRGHGDLERRYGAIADALRFAPIDALSRTSYLAEGVRVHGIWWPAVEMDWIAGRPLDEEVEARLNDSDAMLALAEDFREMVRALGALGIAHGDLQAGNIIVTRAGLRLIDYDAMFLPALAGLPQTQYGHGNYQHPERRAAAFDGRIDRFSAIVIYTALVALSADRSLWPRFNDGKSLLFRAHDFTSKGRSVLFRSLRDTNVASGLVQVLLAACRGPVEDVPTLEDAIRAAAGTMRALASVPSLRRRASKPSKRWPRVAGLFLCLTAFAGLATGFKLEARSHGIAHPALAKPIPHATLVVTKAAASPLPTTVPNDTAVQGEWQIEEANRALGRTVWAADAVVSHRGIVVFDAHQASVAGRSASQCERRTDLHAEFAARGTDQTVPFTETNCVGDISLGEVRVANFSPGGRSFNGTFWLGGTKLGDFTASKQ